MERGVHDLLDESRGDGGVRARARRVLTEVPSHTKEGGSLAHLTRRCSVGCASQSANLLVRAALSRPKDDTGPEHETVRGGSTPGPRFKLALFLRGQNDRESDTNGSPMHNSENILSPTKYLSALGSPLYVAELR